MEPNQAASRPNRNNRRIIFGSRFFAVVNAVFISAMVIFSIYVMANNFAPSDPKHMDPERKTTSEDFFYTISAIVFFIGSIIAFLFAMVLYCGIRKRKLVLLKAYIIFGIVVIVLSTMGALAYTIIYWQRDFSMVVRILPIVIGICLIYAAILRVINRAAALFASGVQYNPAAREEVKMVENYNQNRT